MNIRNLARLVYVLFGAAYLAAGVTVLLYRTGTLPMNAIYMINQISRDSPTALRIMQEFGTHMLAIGFMALWFAYQYELSWVFHWAMTIAWGAFALIHWLDARAVGLDYRAWINSAIPFFVFVVVGFLRWRSERGGW